MCYLTIIHDGDGITIQSRFLSVAVRSTARSWQMGKCMTHRLTSHSSSSSSFSSSSFLVIIIIIITRMTVGPQLPTWWCLAVSLVLPLSTAVFMPLVDGWVMNDDQLRLVDHSDWECLKSLYAFGGCMITGYTWTDNHNHKRQDMVMFRWERT